MENKYTPDELKSLEKFVWEYLKNVQPGFAVSIPPFIIRMEKCNYDWDRLMENLKDSYMKFDYIKYLNIPYEDLPLHINDLDGGLKRPIVSWRLHVGR